MGSFGFGGGARGEESGGSGEAAGQGNVWKFEGRSGHGGDLLPAGDVFRGAAEVSGKPLVGTVGSELKGE